MDHKLKDLLERAESWPEESQDELIRAATEIDARVMQSQRTTKKPVPAKQVEPSLPPPRTVYEALMRAPKTGQLRRPKSVRVKIRPLVTLSGGRV